MSAKRNKALATCNEVACHPRTVVASDQPLMRPFSPSAERFDTSREEVCKRSGTSNECLTACRPLVGSRCFPAGEVTHVSRCL